MKLHINEAEGDFIKIGNRVLPKNAAGLGYADYDTVSRAGKKAYDDEQEAKRIAAEKEAKKKKAAEAIERFEDVYSGYKNEVDNTNVDSLLEDLFDEFVPAEGKTESLAAELIRAIVRLRYRWSNDGDRFNQGYGLETCASSAAFIAENTNGIIEKKVNNMAEHDPSWPDDSYEQALDNLSCSVVKYIASNLELFGENTEDSRDYTSSLVDDWTEWSHCLEYEPDLSGEYLDRLMDAELLSWDDVREFIGDCVNSLGGSDYWWASDAVNIQDLNQDEWDEWNDNFDRWWGDWLDERMEENEDALYAYENGEDDDEDYDEDMDESYSSKRSVKESLYVDVDGIMGTPNEIYSTNFLKSYWDCEINGNDYIVDEYNSFEDWLKDTTNAMVFVSKYPESWLGRKWKDWRGCMGTPNKTYTFEDLIRIWVKDSASDPSMMEFADFDEWFETTVDWMEEV